MANSGDSFDGEDGGGNRTKIVLRGQIASSGEGEIWHTSVPGQICKTYKAQPGVAPRKAQQDLDRRGEKLKVMLAHPPKDPAAPDGISIAWPTRVARNGQGRIVGFTMPEVVGAQRPNFLYNQALRKRTAPGIDWFYIHTAALNVAKVCSAVHERGYIIGDLKADNWLIDSSMQTVIIDTDSFQIRDPRSGRLYHCSVGTGEYTAREILGKDFSTFERMPQHDHFAMAVLIYQLLMGQHPFTGGIYQGRNQPPSDNPTVSRIEQGAWLYHHRSQYRPVANDPPLDVLHPSLQVLFRRSFDDGHRNPSARPSGKEWEAGLETAINALAWCTAGEMHVYSGHKRTCSWCAFLKVTGHDRWPTYKKGASRSFGVAKLRVQHAFRAGDFLQVLNTADSNPKLRAARELQTIIAEVEKRWRPVKKAMEELRAELAKPDPDIAAVAAMLAREPRLAALAQGAADLSAKLAQAMALDAAAKDLAQAIATAPGPGGVFPIDGERNVAETFLKHEKVLSGRGDLQQRFGKRVKEARERVGHFDKLSAALAAGDEPTVQQEMQQHGAVLHSVAELQTLGPEAERIVRRVSALDRFIAAAAASDVDDEVLCRLWESEPGIAESRLAKIPAARLGNIAPAERYARARTLIDAVVALSALVQSLDAKAGTQIVADNESRILASYRDAEARAGSLAHAAKGRLKARAGLAHERNEGFTLVGRLMRLPATQDCEVARAWRQVLHADRYRLESAVRRRLAEAEETCRKVEAVQQIVAQKGMNEADIVAYADRTTDLLQLPAATTAMVDGMPLVERVALARRRVAALAEMEAAIARANLPGADAPASVHAREKVIADLWGTHRRVLEPWTAAATRLAARVNRATERVTRTEALAAAYAAGEQAQLLASWGSDGALDDYEPAASFKPAVEEARRVAVRLQALRDRLVKTPDDDAAILNIARSIEPSFMATTYAKSPLAELGGKSINDLVALAERRARFVEELGNAAREPTGRKLLALAAAWNPAFNRSHPRIKPHVHLIEEGQRLRDKLGRLRAGLKAGDQDAILAYWDDGSFGGLPELAAEAPRIKQALQSYLEKTRPFAPRPLGGVTRRLGHRIQLAWDWRDDKITHASVLIGDRRLPQNKDEALEARLVDRDAIIQRGGIEVDFRGGLLVAEIRPALVFQGKRLEGPHRIAIREATKRVLDYRIEASMMGLGGRVLKIQADRPMQLPELELVAGESDRLLAWSETPTDKDGKLDIDLGRTLSLRRRQVILRLKNASDADWVEIRHPSEAERRIAG